ncbi:MAG: ABC-F family ATP-binding cassette domain-containing protein, partial [Candidatus Sumerlaeota bacterium]|nr:ABC-F family ATP-binding cassette domain-containing protein [Candidatus Sumerlaeota bacterium]
MFSVQNITCQFGGRLVLRDVSLRVEDSEKLAIVGANGTGKSTLLQIIAGRMRPDAGLVDCPKGSSIGYLPQEALLDSALSLRDELLTVFASVHEVFDELRELEHRMAEVAHETDEFNRIARRYDFLQGEIHRLDAYAIDSTVAETAAGLGFTAADLDRPCAEFSGGWRARIVLAKVLLSRPDLLLLDEPTNHLDLESMLWLEEWIRSSRASVAMVSHERAFMDRLAHQILELADGQAALYQGNYSAYLAQRADRRAQQQRAYDNQQQKIREIEKFIARFRYNASKASLVQSRVKQLEKIERLAPPPAEPRSIHFNFPPAERSNKEVAIIKGGSKRYGDREVLPPFELTIYRGERIAVVGLNGAGKSTLLRLLAGTEPLTTGTRTVGTTVRIEYFEQFESDLLVSDRTVLREMMAVAPVGQADGVRDLLGAFLFKEDDVDKPVRVLSGGEKTRLRLAKMLFSRANCLILDEPTNHLDLASRVTLENALRRFTGSLVLVSHDRVFLDRVANRVLEVREGRLRSFPGNYTDYLNATGGQGFLPANLNPARGLTPSAAPLDRAGGARAADPKAQRQADREARKALERRQRKLQRDLQAAERKVAELERALESIHARM